MIDKYRGMILASFTADCLALGAHWIYDTRAISENFGIIDSPQTPLPDSYHPNKKKGDFTHYGDQSLLLLRSIVEDKGYNPVKHSKSWQEFMSCYTGYLDHASKETLANLNAGKDIYSSGSASSELGGTATISPIVYYYRANSDLFFTNVQKHTSLTHNSATSISAAKFLGKITFEVLHGLTPTAAVHQAIEQGIDDLALDMKIRQVLELKKTNTREVIKQNGQACDATAALPGVVHLITTYENNLKQALVENVMAGGDSAARGLATGMILGAHSGMNGIPENWLREMNSYSEICSLLDQLTPEV